MKNRNILWLFIFIMMFSAVRASGSLNAGFTYAVYQSPEGKVYVETWLSINASTVRFVPVGNGKYGGEVEVVLTFFQEDSVVTFDKYTLKSQEIDHPEETGFGFLDLQRFWIDEGNYDLEISLRDVNTTDSAVVTNMPVEVYSPRNKLSISTVQFIERLEPTVEPSVLSRAGYDMFPDMHSFFPAAKTDLRFYAEIYHSVKEFGADGMFLLSAYIESFETNKVLNNLVFHRREKASPVVVCLHSFNIEQLPSGNYNLVVEVRSPENKLVAISRNFFQRSNPGVMMKMEDIQAIDVDQVFTSAYNQKDTLIDYIKSCMPRADDMERVFAGNVISGGNIVQMQQFLYHFWYTRNNLDPQQEWETYREAVNMVNRTYGTFISKGYDTDRGRIYLKYGEPNTIYRSTHEPEAYPYEIWHYYQLTENQSNRKFVFINTGLGVPDFDLAHSNAIGEMNDPQWHLRLHGRNVGGTDVDRTEYNTNYGSRALEIFNNPY